MLSFILIFLFAILGAAIPVNETGPALVLSWTGEVAGHGMVTLYGDANSVEEQIFALNPSLAKDYVPATPFMSRTPAAYNASEVFATSNSTYYYKYPAGAANEMAIRDDVNGAWKLSQGPRPTDWYCATFATGDVSEAWEVVARVGSPGGQDPKHAMWTIAGAVDGKPSCMRLACAGDKGRPGSTAVYWCNDNNFEVTTEASNLAAVAASVATGHKAFNFAGCCLQSQRNGKHHQYSGQMHFGNGTNINVGYGDCSRPDYFTNPSSFSYPGALGSCT